MKSDMQIQTESCPVPQDLYRTHEQVPKHWGLWIHERRFFVEIGEHGQIGQSLLNVVTFSYLHIRNSSENLVKCAFETVTKFNLAFKLSFGPCSMYAVYSSNGIGRSIPSATRQTYGMLDRCKFGDTAQTDAPIALPGT
eukprot:1194042-Prorocentrum_minimum.AAC.1